MYVLHLSIHIATLSFNSFICLNIKIMLEFIFMSTKANKLQRIKTRVFNFIPISLMAIPRNVIIAKTLKKVTNKNIHLWIK